MNTDKRHLERLEKGEEYYRKSSRLTIFNDVLNECLPDLIDGRMTAEELAVELHEHHKLWYIFRPTLLRKTMIESRLGDSDD